MKFLIAILLLLSCHYTRKDNNIAAQASHHSPNSIYEEAEQERLRWFGRQAKTWCTSHHYNNRFFFLADMALPSGKNRFFVYDMQADSIVCSSLVAHGCCNYRFLSKAHFSNEIGCGCSSFGKYKTGAKYEGNYGIAYRLTGLDSSNSNAAKRNIVLHSYYSIPGKEVYPDVIGNSYGCVMVSETFFKTLELKIDASSKPVLLWVAE